MLYWDPSVQRPSLNKIVYGIPWPSQQWFMLHSEYNNQQMLKLYNYIIDNFMELSKSGLTIW